MLPEASLQQLESRWVTSMASCSSFDGLMVLRLAGSLILSLAVLNGPAADAEDELSPLLQRRWFEARSLHFNAYSCGETQQVPRLIGRLQQFRLAYSLLAGAQAVASPPIIVLAFPDSATMRPFLPQR